MNPNSTPTKAKKEKQANADKPARRSNIVRAIVRGVVQIVQIIFNAKKA